MANEDGEEQSLITLQKIQNENLGSIDISDDADMVIKRPVYSQTKFDEGYECEKRYEESFGTFCKKKVQDCKCSSCLNFFPFIKIMRKYNFRDFMTDLVAGLTVGIMHIPQGMAYGLLAQLPPIYGLYVSFFPVILYFFFGTSRHISIGTFAVVCLMVGAVVDKGYSNYSQQHGLVLSSNISNMPISTTLPSTFITSVTEMQNSSTAASVSMSDDADKIKLGYALAVTFLVGCIQLVMGVFHMGFVTTFLSDPLVSGFTTGAACHVFTSQIKHIFGIKMGQYSGPLRLIYSYIDVFSNISETNLVTFGMSAASIIIIALVKELINNNPKVKPKLKIPVPIELIMVVLGTVTSYFLNLHDNHNVRVVGKIATGIPAPVPPPFRLIGEVVTDAIAIAIVAFAVNVSMSKILAKKHGYEIDPNQELIAYAICNIFSSFFSSFCSAASLSRSLVQEDAGGTTQVTGLVSSCLILVVLLVVGPLFQSLPNCVLAAIILVALKGMFKQFNELRRLWGISKIDFAVWLAAFLGTALLDVDYGLGVGVGFSLLTVLARSSRPYACLLGQIPNTDIYGDLSVYKSAQEVPGIKIVCFESSLYFANSENFRNRLYELTGLNPRDLKKQQLKAEKQKRIMMETGNSNGLHEFPTTPVKAIIIDCSCWSYLDSVGVKVLSQIISEYRSVDVKFLLTHCKSGIREMLEKAGFYDTVDRHCLFVTIHDAVLSVIKPTTQPLGLINDEKNISKATTSSQLEVALPNSPHPV